MERLSTLPSVSSSSLGSALQDPSSCPSSYWIDLQPFSVLSVKYNPLYTQHSLHEQHWPFLH